MIYAIVGCYPSTARSQAPVVVNERAELTGGASLSLPTLTICMPPSGSSSPFVTRSLAPGMSYSCRSICPRQDGSDCTYTTRDIFKLPMATLAFVTDEMGGELRWNAPPPEGASAITAVTYLAMGGSGSTWMSESPGHPGRSRNYFSCAVRDQWIQQQHLARIRVIELRWQPGELTIPGFEKTGMGWFTRKDSVAKDLPTQIGRPAAAQHWAKTWLATGKKFATFGCSAGTYQTLGASYFYNQTADYQSFSGSIPGMWDVNAACAKTLSAGVCEHSGAKVCAHDSDCAPSLCAHPQPTVQNVVTAGAMMMMDYINGIRNVSPNACFRGGTGFSQSGFGTSNYKTYRNFSWPVEFNVGIGGDPNMTDTALSVTYSSWKVAQSITAPRKDMLITTGHHCASFDPEHLNDTLNRAYSRLGLPSQTITNNADLFKAGGCVSGYDCSACGGTR